MSRKDRSEAEISAVAERLVAADFGEGSPHSRERLANHAASSPERAELHASMARLWDDLGRVEPPLLFADCPESQPERSWWQARRGWAIAASVLPLLMAVGVLLSIAGVFGVDYVSSADLRTAANERRIVGLADGSIVTLGADTVLAVEMHHDRRTLTLRQGEALFDVAHDPERPFVVEAGPGSVQAIGTRFNIRLDGDVIVTVAEGTVAVTAGPQSAGVATGLAQIAVGGQQVRFGEGKRPADAEKDRGATGTRGNFISTAQAVDAERFTSWTQGMLRFEGEPLRVVIDEVNRHSARKIGPVDPAIAETPIYGIFHIGDVDGLRQVVRDIRKIEKRESVHAPTT